MTQFQRTFNCVILAALLLGCGGPSSPQGSSTSPKVLRLATTTSLRDSGLLDELLPTFEKSRNCRVDVIAVGTGAALKLGESGDADAVLVHARGLELVFLEAGHAVRHEEFMWNQFVILGPANDPGQIKAQSPVNALRTLARTKQKFLSRGDDSGTHQREKMLWQNAGGFESWDGYLESGQGMGPTLIMANEMLAYALCDQGTYLNFREKIELVPLVADKPALRNPYAVMVINPKTHPSVDSDLAHAWADYLIAPETQRRIAAFRIGGEPLFFSTRLPSD